jgi:hypothetical protein
MRSFSEPSKPEADGSQIGVVLLGGSVVSTPVIAGSGEAGPVRRPEPLHDLHHTAGPQLSRSCNGQQRRVEVSQ